MSKSFTAEDAEDIILSCKTLTSSASSAVNAVHSAVRIPQPALLFYHTKVRREVVVLTEHPRIVRSRLLEEFFCFLFFVHAQEDP